MGRTAADTVVDRLAEAGIGHVFGYPGDGVNGILGALRRNQERVRFLQVRHEEMAAFMACAQAKFTGDVGVCVATSGPGAVHLLNGLYDAKLDHQPVVAIVGQTFATAMGGDQQQEIDLLSLYKDVAAAYVQQVTTPAAVRHCIDRAISIARAERTVTAVIVPADVQDMDAVDMQKQAIKSIHTEPVRTRPRVVPADEDLRAAADVLNGGRKVAILVGAGAQDAADDVLAVADTLGAGIAKALLGKAVIPDDVPFCTGAIGLLGTRPSWELMQGCDTLLMIGTSFPYANFLPPNRQARAVQIDIAARKLSLRYPVEVALVGDARDTLRELLPLLRRQEDRSWRQDVERSVEEWWRLMDEQGQPRDQNGRVRPQPLFAAISRSLPDDAIITSDSGSAANWYARHIRIRRGMKASLSGNLATMLPGVPYAIAAKFVYPERVSVALVGDGAMHMGGMAEMLTAAKHYREWEDPRLVVLVLNNGDLNQVTWEQRVFEGDAKFQVSQEIPVIRFDEWARLIGLHGIRVEHSDQIAEAVREAFASDRPVIIDALTDPEEPPLPPHITFEQARHFALSMFRGEAHPVREMLTAARDMAEELRPRR